MALAVGAVVEVVEEDDPAAVVLWVEDPDGAFTANCVPVTTVTMAPSVICAGS
jgi:hypothetical protein